MNRNKFILCVALVLMLILVVAFVGQIRGLRKQWRSTVRIFPTEEKKSREDLAQNGLNQDSEKSSRQPEILVRFRAGVSDDAINEIAGRFNDHIQDEIEA